MAEIRVFAPPTAEEPTFRRLGIVQAATDVTVSERLWSPGSFSVTVPAQARHAHTLTQGRLVLVEGTFWGIVDDWSLEASSAGMTRTASGRQLKGLTADRITIPPEAAAVTGAQGYDAVTGPTETIMKHFVSVNLGPGAALAARRVHGLTIAPDQGRGLEADKYMSRHQVLSDVLATLGEAAGLGYDITPDLAAQGFVFDVVAGEDHTALQSHRTRVIFDVGRRTAASQTYQHAGGDGRNLFYATVSGSEFADEALTVSYVREGEDEPVGIARRETHLSVSVSTPEAGSEYDELKGQVLAQAEGYRPAESFTCEILEGRYVYGRDYRLGDLVTVRSLDWGIEMHARLTGMETSFSSSGIRRTATFGTAPLNVISRLRREMKRR